MARIPVIEQADATGELATIYAEITQSRGKLAEVHKVQSLNPQSIRDHMGLYRTVMFSSSPLSRATREIIAVVVSSINGCHYCVRHHGAALNHFWKDPPRVDALARDGSRYEGLSEQDAALCAYAEAVTRAPGAAETETVLQRVRQTGIDERGILDATLVTAYFNFVNRMVLALGVELEDDAGGFRYE